MYGYVYKTTNLINGKIYVGKHRCSEFTENYKGSGKVLWNAINKYGWDNFKVELLEECTSEDHLNGREKYWISHLNSQDKSIGYNIGPGGEGWQYDKSGKSNPFYGKHHSEETKKRWSEIRKGRKLSEEAIRKQIAAQKGRKLSEETRNKISVANKGRPHSLETRKKLSDIGKSQVVRMYHPIKGRFTTVASSRVNILKSYGWMVEVSNEKNNSI